MIKIEEQGAKVFTIVDMDKAYWQVVLHQGNIPAWHLT